MKNLRLKLLALISVFLLASPVLAKPNIVVVMVDDLDVDVWNEARRRGWLTNIEDHLIGKGTTFDQTFVSQSLCCPSRATFHTGQYPHNSGVTGNSGVYDAFKANKEPHALATWIKAAGYRTGYIGKYLNDSGGEAEGYKPPGWDDWYAMVQNNSEPDSGSQCMYGYTLADGGTGRKFYGDPHNPTNPDNYQTDVLAKLAESFIKKPGATGPFFVVVAPTVPHVEGLCKGPYVDSNFRVRTAPRYAGMPTLDLPFHITDPAGSYNEEDISDKPRWMRGELPPRFTEPLRKNGNLERRKQLFNEKVAALRPVDDMVKRIVDALGSKLGNTMIMFISDNGYQYGTHRRTTKQDLYEESIRVPMVVRAPQQTLSRTSQAWILNNDWAPTIAAYAGATVSPQNVVDGRSFRPLLGNSPTGTGKRHTFMVRTGPNPDTGVALGGHFSADDPEESEHVPFLMVRTRHQPLTLETDGRTLVYGETYYSDDGSNFDVEFYDLKTDPPQKTSEHASTDTKRVDQRRKLKNRLNALKICSGNTCRQLEGI